jgi:RNA polymerase sigma-70 factor (ECF subfamily)
MESTDRISPQVLAALLNKHGRGLEVYAAQWSDSPGDCVQDAFVKLAAQSPQPENSIAWLYRVTRNNAISSLRASKRREKHESFVCWLNAHENKSTDPAKLLADSDDRSQLVNTLQYLDDSERELVVMRIWSELTWDQIGQLTNRSASSAQRNYVATLKKLRTLLESSCLTKPN